ncbi:siderophore-interacting protein [Pseudonocardia phyllosphaerae]|uniref:siderophore-interacting protein n=1 Tax=Pseudonocardia phyllosphaerae TaxID=3390502 RepID=UPI00397C8F7D
MTQPLPPYVLGRVTGAEPVTPLMRRITLEADDWCGAVPVAPDQQVKLFFARDGGVPEVPGAPEDGSGVAGWYARYLAVPEDVRPWMRSYTVRHLDPDEGVMVIDFVLHGGGHGAAGDPGGGHGPASHWAESAGLGDVVGVLGPAIATYRTPSGEPVRLLVGDETALPAIGAIVEQLPAGTRAVVVAEVAGPAEEQVWGSEAEQELHWVHRGTGLSLPEAVRTLALPDEPVFAWVAGEASDVRAVRRHLVGERGLAKQSVSFTGYWRRDMTQDDAPTEQDMADAAEQMAAAGQG